jgi:Protein of unknown function (DUF3617)
MKAKRGVTIPVAILLAASLAAAQVGAADAPKRKSGLWEVKTQMSGMPAGMPGSQPMQMCVDQNSDNVMRDQARGKVDCPVMEIKRSGGKVTFHSVCKSEGTTVTTDGVMSGDFESAYRSDMTMSYAPPKHGMATMKMSQEARWLGPCKPGQKPGDVSMPGMATVNPGNMQEMMKDPQFREMMRQQGGR